MTVEAAGYIDDIDPTQPLGTDQKKEGDDHLRNFKKSVQDSFPNISGAMTATHTELNNLNGYTGNTADLNVVAGAAAGGLTAAELLYVAGATSDLQTQITARLVAADNLSDLASATTARTNLGLGSIAVETTIGGDNLDAATAGDYLEESATISGSDIDALVGTSYAKVLEIRVPRAGTYRARSSILGTAVGSDNIYGTIYVNGVAQGVEHSSFNTRSTRNDDVACSAGDLIQLYCKTQLASQIPDGPAYLMVCTGNPVYSAATYSYKGLP